MAHTLKTSRLGPPDLWVASLEGRLNGEALAQCQSFWMGREAMRR